MVLTALPWSSGPAAWNSFGKQEFLQQPLRRRWRLPLVVVREGGRERNLVGPVEAELFVGDLRGAHAQHLLERDAGGGEVGVELLEPRLGEPTEAGHRN